jgi:hypothetical protein
VQSNPIARWHICGSAINDTAFSPDGNYLATVGRDGKPLNRTKAEQDDDAECITTQVMLKTRFAKPQFFVLNWIFGMNPVARRLACQERDFTRFSYSKQPTETFAASLDQNSHTRFLNRDKQGLLSIKQPLGREFWKDRYPA